MGQFSGYKYRYDSYLNFYEKEVIEKYLKDGELFALTYKEQVACVAVITRVNETVCELNTINYHIKKIYEDNKIDEDSTIRNFRIVRKEGNRDVSRNVQNKLHYAVSGNKAAEIIYNRADHKKEHMGLTSWKGTPDSKIL